MKFRPSIAQRLILTLLLLMLFTVLVFSLGINLALKRTTLKEAEDKTKLLSSLYLSIHKYFTEILKPNLLRKIQEGLLSDEFDPTWMSSSYVISHIQEYFQEQFSQGYSFEEVAINARNPLREANEEEAAFIRQMNNDPAFSEKFFFRKTGEDYSYILFKKGEIIEQSCLECHGDPADEPPGLVAQYGDKRAFRYNTGQVVSAQIYKIPLTSLYKNRNNTTFIFTVMMLLFCGCMILLILLINRKFILAPLASLNTVFLKVADDRKASPAPVDERSYPVEFRSIIRNYNLMSSELWEYETNLTAMVDDKTRALKDMVAMLKTMVREAHHRIKNNLNQISGYILIQREQAEIKESKEILNSIISRIEGISLIHDTLCREPDFNTIDGAAYLNTLLEQLSSSLLINSAVRCEWSISADIPAGIRDVQEIGMIIAELFINSIKNCDDSRPNPVISLTVLVEDSTLTISVKNPATVKSGDRTCYRGVGMEIIEAIVRQMKGSFSAEQDHISFHTRISIPLSRGSLGAAE